MAVSKAKLASEILGVGPGGGELAKLTISYKYGKGQTGIVDALFNPSEISLSRSVRWKQKSVAQQSGSWAWSDMVQNFREVNAETLSIELFFDTYESRSSGNLLKEAAKSLIPPNPFQKRDASPVTKYTKQIAKLAKVDRERHEPPICNLQWGTFKIFRGVLTDLQQKFTLFLDDGTPVRGHLVLHLYRVRHQSPLQSQRIALGRCGQDAPGAPQRHPAQPGRRGIWRPGAMAANCQSQRHCEPAQRAAGHGADHSEVKTLVHHYARLHGPRFQHSHQRREACQ